MNFLQLFSGSLGNDPRPTKFYHLLRSLGHVTVYAAPPAPGFELQGTLLEIPEKNHSLPGKAWRAAGLLCHRYEHDIWSQHRKEALRTLKGQDFSAIVCHDCLLLPLALAVRDARKNTARPCPVIMDAREFYPREFEENPLWKLFLSGLNHYVCRTYFPRADHIFTVSPGLERGYAEEYGLRTEVLPSFPYLHTITPPPQHDGPLRCIHHGAAIPERHLESMIEAFALLQGKASLDFMLVPNNENYYNSLKEKAKPYANIAFVPPVPMKDIVRHIAAYDMGVFLLGDHGFNHRHLLPNKFFEYIQARLAVAISPVPDMAALTRRYDIGVVSDDFSAEAFAARIMALQPADVARYRHNACQAAQELCWEHNEARLRSCLASLMENRQ